MGITLSEGDFRPIAGYEFQHWGERTGQPYAAIRPLTPAAAERVWRRAVELGGVPWADGGTDAGAGRLDLQRPDAEWDDRTVCRWLLERVPDRDLEVLVCYQPQVAVAVPWGLLCEHWLLLLWTGGCVWPPDEAWVLVHDGDQFAFAARRAKKNEDGR
jgi:hypothetical protein